MILGFHDRAEVSCARRLHMKGGKNKEFIPLLPTFPCPTHHPCLQGAPVSEAGGSGPAGK